MEKSKKKVSAPDFKINGRPYSPKEGDEVIFVNIDAVKHDGCAVVYTKQKSGWSVYLRVDGYEIHSNWLRKKYKEGARPCVLDAIRSAYGLDASVSYMETWETWTSKPPRPALKHNLRHHSMTTYRLKRPD